MTDGTESFAPEAEEATGPDNNSAGAASGGNPYWDKVKNSVDELTFYKIQPFLNEADQNASKRIESVNSQLSQYKEFGTPEQIRNFATIAQRIDSEPEVIYQALGDFLKENGRMPTPKEAEKAVAQVEAETEDDYPTAKDPRYDELRQQQEQITQFLQAQEQQRVQAQADSALSSEIDQLKQSHADFSAEDIEEVIRRAAFEATSTGRVPSLEEAAQGYLDNVVNRIRSTPRPADSAPRLLPTGGAASPGQQNRSIGSLSRNETQDLVATLIAQNNAANRG